MFPGHTAEMGVPDLGTPDSEVSTLWATWVLSLLETRCGASQSLSQWSRMYGMEGWNTLGPAAWP